MKIELHLHTLRYSGCAKATPAEAMERLIQTGYDAVYITEHDAVWSDWELADLAGQFPAIRIFPGVEVSLNRPSGELFQHLLVLGTNDRRYVELADGPADILAKAHNEGCLTVLAHPYRYPTSCRILDEGLRPDAMEHRSKNHDASMAAQAAATAERMRIPLVNAGDAHALEFFNRFWIETEAPLNVARDIRDIILSGRYRNCEKTD